MLASPKRRHRSFRPPRSGAERRASGCVLAWGLGDVQSVGVEPYRIEVPDGELERLRLRLADVRWPDRETVEDWSRVCRCRWYGTYATTGVPAMTGAPQSNG